MISEAGSGGRVLVAVMGEDESAAASGEPATCVWLLQVEGRKDLQGPGSFIVARVDLASIEEADRDPIADSTWECRPVEGAMG